jgi:hypothetical protein
VNVSEEQDESIVVSLQLGILRIRSRSSGVQNRALEVELFDFGPIYLWFSGKSQI